MKRLTLGCLLLGFLALSSLAIPAPQSERQASGGSRCDAGFKECQEGLKDFKEAEQFMQLKATLLADLERMAESNSTNPKIAPLRDAPVNHLKARDVAVHNATVGPNRKMSEQVSSAVQPVSVESTAGTPSYKRVP